MPKGRGARNRGRPSADRGKRPKSKGSTKRAGIPGLFPRTTNDLQRRAEAAGAGGYTREERKRSRQRETEAERAAARKVARAARDRL